MKSKVIKADSDLIEDERLKTTFLVSMSPKRLASRGSGLSLWFNPPWISCALINRYVELSSV